MRPLLRFFLAATLFSLCLGFSPAAVQARSSEPTVYTRLDAFAKILYHIESEYVDPVDDRVLVEKAIQGMLSGLDPHSMYLPAEHFRELKVDTEGKFGGVGLEVTTKDGWLVVVAPVEGTPAEAAGFRPGDRIIKINGKTTRTIPLNEAVSMMRGRRGTPITFTVVRGEGRPAFEVKLKRAVIRITSVRGEMPEAGYGYLRLSSFQETTSAELERSLAHLEREGALKGLILDLRNNPGGLLDQAVEVSDLFLDKGTIVTIRRRGRPGEVKEARAEGKERKYPLIVLVNGGSASAAEIVAGALQDNKRAKLLGSKTFGKGSVQTIFELGDGSALKLTVAKYYTPSGRSIQDEGIVPDMVIAPQEDDITSENKKVDIQRETALNILAGRKGPR